MKAALKQIKICPFWYINNSILAPVKAFHESGAFIRLNHSPLPSPFFSDVGVYQSSVDGQQCNSFDEWNFCWAVPSIILGNMWLVAALLIIHHSGNLKFCCRQKSNADRLQRPVITANPLTDAVHQVCDLKKQNLKENTPAQPRQRSSTDLLGTHFPLCLNSLAPPIYVCCYMWDCSF